MQFTFYTQVHCHVITQLKSRYLHIPHIYCILAHFRLGRFISLHKSSAIWKSNALHSIQSHQPDPYIDWGQCFMRYDTGTTSSAAQRGGNECKITSLASTNSSDINLRISTPSSRTLGCTYYGNEQNCSRGSLGSSFLYICGRTVVNEPRSIEHTLDTKP